MDMNKMTIIYTVLYNAAKANEKASLKTVICEQTENCGAYKNSQCIVNSLFGYCPYAKVQWKWTKTKRCKCYKGEYAKLKEECENAQYKKLKNDCINYLCGVGEYIYIPYANADMCALVPFMSHSQLFTGGRPFIKKEYFTAKTIVELAKFRPRALFGEEITQYQTKEVPKFLYHLSIFYPELYQEAAKLDNTIINKTFKSVELKELTCTLDKIVPGEIRFRLIHYGHTAFVNNWNGSILDITFEDYCPVIFFDNIKEKPMKIVYSPIPEQTKVIVRNPELIQLIIFRHPEVIST
jgi:hypothetical protein